MIKSFKDEDTRRFFKGANIARFQAIATGAARQLMALDSAATLHDLAVLRSTRLEVLHDVFVNQFSITIDPPWRIFFSWNDNGPYNVEIVDHD